jgi:hypothetical protein
LVLLQWKVTVLNLAVVISIRSKAYPYKNCHPDGVQSFSG